MANEKTVWVSNASLKVNKRVKDLSEFYSLGPNWELGQGRFNGKPPRKWTKRGLLPVLNRVEQINLGYKLSWTPERRAQASERMKKAREAMKAKKRASLDPSPTPIIRLHSFPPTPKPVQPRGERKTNRRWSPEAKQQMRERMEAKWAENRAARIARKEAAKNAPPSLEPSHWLGKRHKPETIEKLRAYRRKRIGAKNSMFGRVWVHHTGLKGIGYNINRAVTLEEAMELGPDWDLGRAQKKAISNGKNDTHWIHHPSTGHEKMVRDVSQYLASGWVFGRKAQI